MITGLNLAATFYIKFVPSKGFFDVLVILESRITGTRLLYDKNLQPIHHGDTFSKHSPVIWPAWLNSCVFVYKQSV